MSGRSQLHGKHGFATTYAIVTLREWHATQYDRQPRAAPGSPVTPVAADWHAMVVELRNSGLKQHRSRGGPSLPLCLRAVNAGAQQTGRTGLLSHQCILIEYMECYLHTNRRAAVRGTSITPIQLSTAGDRQARACACPHEVSNGLPSKRLGGLVAK